MPRSQDTATDINGKFTIQVENLPKTLAKTENEPHTAHINQQDQHNQMKEEGQANTGERTQTARKRTPERAPKENPYIFLQVPARKRALVDSQEATQEILIKASPPAKIQILVPLILFVRSYSCDPTRRFCPKPVMRFSKI